MLRALIFVLALASQALAQGYICAEGGGNAGKGQWADEVFGWMVQKGNRGKVVILGAVKLDEDSRPALFTRLGAAGVESLVVTQENADTQETYDTIAAASVVFIRGGAQSRYVQWWKGTKTQQAIVDVYKKGGVVAGTSAGCAVLGEVVYDAIHGSLSAREALADGRHENLSLTTGFLNLVPGVLFDTHFTERGRLARLPVMLAHCKEDLKRDDILGIGVDPRTAVCIGPDGIAEIRGEGTVTVLRLTAGSRLAINKGVAPTVTGVEYLQLPQGAAMDLRGRRVVRRPADISPRAPAGLPTFRSGQAIDGGDANAALLGSVRLALAPPDTWLRSDIARGPATGQLASFMVVPYLFEASAGANNLAGTASTLASPERAATIALLVDVGVLAATGATSISVVPGLDGPPARSLMVLDGRTMAYAGIVRGARPAAMLESATLHILAPGWRFDFATGLASPVGQEK